MDGEKLDVSEIMRRVTQILRLSSGAVLLFISIVSAATIVVDLTDPDSGWRNLLLNILSVIAGFLLMRAVVRDSGLTDGFVRGFGAYFGLSILMGLALLLGFVCLIIPGLILLVRWQPAFAILMVEENATVTGAMQEAWDMTAAEFWPLLASVLFGIVILGVALLVYVSYDLGYAVPVEFSVVAGNILLTCVTVYFTVLGVAAYSLLRTKQPGLDEIFA